MKKNYQKGFMLVETLIVSTFTASVFLFIYVQFNNLNKGYKNSFKYDSIEEQYALADVVSYLNGDSLFSDKIKEELEMSDSYYLNITNCDSTLYANSTYCNRLYELENIKNIFVIREGFKPDNKDFEFSQGIKEYLDKITKQNSENKYRVIVEFENNNIASDFINVEEG